jgi:hypothetical protein
VTPGNFNRIGVLTQKNSQEEEAGHLSATKIVAFILPKRGV